MCGIVGVVGLDATKDVLLDGLMKLEYRGYDSAGIYVSDGQKGHLFKSAGKIQNLNEKVPKEVKGTFGIGHTRWATHGNATSDNAHPHFSNDGRFYLVHNGVIENYQELKNQYLKDIVLHSQTDTEVVVQLIAKIAQEENISGFQAFKKTINLVRGSYAFLLVDNENPEHLYLAKNKSPLLIGVGSNFNVATSDALAMINQTNEFIEVEDGDVVDLTNTNVTIFNQDGVELERNHFVVDLDANNISKGVYKFYMQKEMEEQPTVIRQIINNYYRNTAAPIIAPDILNKLAEADRIYILAAGTSYHAGLVGKELFEKMAKIPVEVDLASEFGHHLPLLSKKPFFIFLSQSGETADSRQVLVKVKDMGLPSLTITNVKQSTLAREADYKLELFAGPEIAVASTKAYTAQITVQAILADALRRFKGLPLPLVDFDLQHELSLVAAGMEEIISEQEKFDEITKTKLADTKNAFYIGRGLDYPLSLEAALKLKEVSYIQTEGFAAAELKHGTISLIEENTPVFAFINDESTAELTRGNIQEVKARGANVTTFALESLSQPDDDFVLPNVNYLLSPLVGVLPAQFIAYYASLNRGYNVDQPRNLAKSVTVE